MTDTRTLIVVAVVVGLVVPVGAVAPATATTTSAQVASQSNDDTNSSSVNVSVGQQLSTVLETSESDVGSEVDEAAFEASFEGADETEQAEAIAERAEELREQAREIREDYRNATREYENGELSRSEYAQRIATLNARASNLLESHERLQGHAANVSGLELATAGLNRSALRDAVDDVENVTGAGPTALLERFTGQRRGEVEVERADGLSIEVEAEDGERSREFERPRDDDHAITVEQSAALETSRGVLSAQNGSWTLAKASVHTESGYYRFEFALRSDESTGEAKVRVDGSTGQVFRLEEEIEPLAADERDGDDERDESEEDETGADEGEEDSDEVDDLALVVAEGTPAPNATVTVLAVADGTPLANTTVLLDGEPVGETGPDGTLDVTLPAGSSTLTVEAGDENAELELEFERTDDERERADVYRNIEVSATYEDGTVSLTVTYDGAGVGNVTVYANGERVGRTDADGTVTFPTDATEELEIELVRGELEAELEYGIRDGSLVIREYAHEGDGDKVGDDGEEVDDLTIEVVDGEPARNATVTVQVHADGAPAANATVSVDGASVGQTGADGRLVVTLPDADEVEVTATAGGEDAEAEFEFEDRDDDATETPEPTETGDEVDGLSLSVVSGSPEPGATITVEVTGGGDPVAGATVSVEGNVAGETGSDGTIQVTLPDDDDPRVRAETDDASGRIEFDFDD